jgi:hypothetical protein
MTNARCRRSLATGFFVHHMITLVHCDYHAWNEPIYSDKTTSLLSRYSVRWTLFPDRNDLRARCRPVAGFFVHDLIPFVQSGETLR